MENGWIQTGLLHWRWINLDWTFALEMAGFRLEFTMDLDLSLQWIQTGIGQDNTRSKQGNSRPKPGLGGEGEEKKRTIKGDMMR